MAARPLPEDRESRLRWFDQATERRKRARRGSKTPPRDRGWRREELYHRGRSR